MIYSVHGYMHVTVKPLVIYTKGSGSWLGASSVLCTQLQLFHTGYVLFVSGFSEMNLELTCISCDFLWFAHANYCSTIPSLFNLATLFSCNGSAYAYHVLSHMSACMGYHIYTYNECDDVMSYAYVCHEIFIAGNFSGSAANVKFIVKHSWFQKIFSLNKPICKRIIRHEIKLLW